MLLDATLDACLDTLRLLPFLLATYLFMEWLEHGAGQRFEAAIARGGRLGPVFGAVLGIVPQCGFSGAAATLYAARVVTLGTLVAVFLVTSDEMLPLMLSQAVAPALIAKVLGIKLAVGLVCGLLLDWLLARMGRLHTGVASRGRHAGHSGHDIHELCEQEGCDCGGGCTCEEHAARGGGGVAIHRTESMQSCDEQAADRACDSLATSGESGGACGEGLCEEHAARGGAEGATDITRAEDGANAAHVESEAGTACAEEGVAGPSHAGHGHAHAQSGSGSGFDDAAPDAVHAHAHGHSGSAGIVGPALRHTLNVSVFILVITLGINLVVEAGLAGALGSVGAPYASTVLCAVIGLVPNCAVSVGVTQLYLDGLLGGGALMAALSTNAGVGLLVLLRTNHDAAENLRIIAMLLGIGIVAGCVVQALGVL